MFIDVFLKKIYKICIRVIGLYMSIKSYVYYLFVVNMFFISIVFYFISIINDIIDIESYI